MRWANENPEQWEEIARLPLNEQNEALRDAIASNRQYAREYAESRIHCHRPLNTSGASPAAAQKPPAGDGRNFLPHRTPVGPDSHCDSRRRTAEDCPNCGAPEGVACQPFCLAEQYS